MACRSCSSSTCRIVSLRIPRHRECYPLDAANTGLRYGNALTHITVHRRFTLLGGGKDLLNNFRSRILDDHRRQGSQKSILGPDHRLQNGRRSKVA